MKRGYEFGGKHSSDPIGSEHSRGKSTFRRKSGRDTDGLTPSELHQKAELMRQFMTNPEGPGGRSQAYCEGYDAIDWMSEDAFGTREGTASGSLYNVMKDLLSIREGNL